MEPLSAKTAMKLTKLILLLVPLWTLAGCLTAAHRYSYSMIFMNTGENAVTDLAITSGEWSFFGPASILVPYAQKVHSGPIPVSPQSVFVFSWISADRVKHTETVDLRSRVGRQFQGEVVLTIDREDRLSVDLYPKIGDYRPPRKPKPATP